ncbi:hypothetical protein EYF80_031097 [Liparis tanakae]|uniref:Uncharacterized protein n=1 Tax=Liparis tanakae TaxID=230148 RepID=A0A4Z2H0S7_9TELE|nr:hypothetical protein EYF80_031097 [Liparis tanakae]
MTSGLQLLENTTLPPMFENAKQRGRLFRSLTGRPGAGSNERISLWQSEYWTVLQQAAAPGRQGVSLEGPPLPTLEMFEEKDARGKRHRKLTIAAMKATAASPPFRVVTLIQQLAGTDYLFKTEKQKYRVLRI